MQTQQTPFVLVCTTSYAPMIGGAELALEHTIKRIPDMRFLVLTARNSRSVPKYERRGHVEIRRLGLGFRLDKWLLPLLIWVVGRGVMRERRKKVLLWGMMISQGTVGAYFLKRSYPRAPFVVTLQEGDSEEYLTSARGGLIDYWWRRILASADHVTAISTYLALRAKQKGYSRLVTIIPNGVDESFVSEALEGRDERELYEFYKIPQESHIILSVSRLVQKNGLEDLIAAHAEIKKHGHKVTLLVVGDGPDQRVLERLVEKLGCADSVIFTGAVLHDRILDYYRIADVFVRPSRSEGLGSVFLEAMGAGVPVVATLVGGIGDIIQDRETGVIVRARDPKDIARGIIDILDNPTFAKRLQHEARERVIQSYLWVDVADSMKRVFQHVL